MDITKTNFKEKYDFIEKTINEAMFLAIDGEFTGLNEELNLSFLDTPEGRYEKLKEGSMQFMMIQFGLCAFKYENDAYSYKPFNFYIFPNSNGKTNDPRFLCQTASMQFLASQGFDFNKLFLDGIPYLTSELEDKLREELSHKHALLEQKLKNGSTSRKNSANDPGMPGDKVQKEHKNFVNDVHAKILEFTKSCKNGDTFDLPPFSNYRRRLVYEMVESEFREQDLDVQTVFDEANNRILRISKISIEGRMKMLKERMENEQKSLQDDVGFSRVVRAISQSGKLVVGHNMLLDVMHVIHQFHTPLPPTYLEFKNCLKNVFPKIADTKVMATTKPFRSLFESTDLNNLLKQTQKEPFEPIKISADPSFDKIYSTDFEKLHEAGYDAYITGLCFISFIHYLEKLKPSKGEEILDSLLIKPFLNKVFMMQSADIPYLNLAGDDIKPSRIHVFHTTFPKEYKIQDLIQLFSAYGPVFVSWINDESAFVSLKNTNQATNAEALTKKHCRGRVTVLKYEDYINQCGSKKHKYFLSCKNSVPVKRQKLMAQNKGDQSKVDAKNIFEEDNDYT